MVPSIQHLKLTWFQSLTIVDLIPFIFLLLILLYKWRLQYTKNLLPPSPPKFPIIGNLHQLGIHPHRSLRSLSNLHGDLMLIHVGRVPILVVSSAKAAYEIMKTHDVTFANRLSTQTSEKLFYKGKDVGTSQYGQYWRQMKSICVLQLLSNTRVLSFRSVREEETILLMENITKSGLKQVDLSEMLSNLVKDVICKVGFGRKYNGGKKVKKLLGELSELLGGFRIGDFVPWLSWMNRFDGWDERIERVTKELDGFLEEVLKQHEDNNNNNVGIHTKDIEEGKDFVDVLLQVQKENTAGFPIGRDSIKALMLDMFIAGSDTSSTVLEWAMTELLRHPIVMEKLKNEVKTITGEKSNVNEDDISKMKYLKAVIKETLRLHPPIPYLCRLSTQDVKINSYHIPSGTTVFINSWAIQRDEAFWENPDKFNPKRFLTSSVDFRGQDFELTPFGAGRRMCPGISFGLVIIELVLANVVHKFDWELPNGIKGESLDMRESTGIAMHRKTPLLAVAKVTNVK